MIVKPGGWSLIHSGLVTCSLLLGWATAAAQDEKPAASGDDLPDHRVVLRLSEAMLNSLIAGKEIDRQVPVSDMVLGTSVTGAARVVGHPSVQLAPSQDEARFDVIVAGTVHSRTIGHNGPAIIQGHSITRFTATKQVVFEPGRGFYGLPPKVNAQTQCFTDGITSTRGGLVGNIVQRRASRQIAEQQGELTAIARARATQRISAAFDLHMDARLARLNRVVAMRTMLAELRDQESNPRVVCRTTPSYVEIADAGDATPMPIVLPLIAAASEASAPIEIWIHASLVPEQLAAALKTMFTHPDQSAVLNALTLLPEALGKEAAAAITALVSENKVSVQNVDGWVVVELNTQTDKSLVAAPNLRR